GFVWAVLLAVLLGATTLLEPSVAMLVAQSATIGVVLTLVTALTHRLVHRRRAPVFGETSGRTGTIAPGSSLNLAPGAGSDDSTPIRLRPVSSTADHPAAGTGLPPYGRAPTGASPGWIDPHG